MSKIIIDIKNDDITSVQALWFALLAAKRGDNNWVKFNDDTIVESCILKNGTHKFLVS